MDAETVINAVSPLLTDGMQRLRVRTKADGRDVLAIFGPVMECAARLAGSDSAAARGRLRGWLPSDVCEIWLHDEVRAIVSEVPNREAMKARQIALEAELKGSYGTR
jgi:hypothetical protein